MLLELKGIKKYFQVSRGPFARKKSVVRAVDGIDLSIQPGENLSLVGESGSGKTTLGRIIMKLTPADTGSIIFDNKDITRLTGKKFQPYRKNIQMVFQDPFNSLDPRFTVRKILSEAMLYDKNQNKSFQEKRMAEMLTAVGLNPAVLNRFPHEFSGGERQRIAIARALIMNPRLLILDEAVSSLDVIVQDQILKLLFDLQKHFKLTYLFISHNLRVVRKISHRIAVMYKGKIVELAPRDAIFNNPMHQYTKELLAAALEYKTAERHAEISLPDNTRLSDRGDGHFVLY